MRIQVRHFLPPLMLSAMLMPGMAIVQTSAEKSSQGGCEHLDGSFEAAAKVDDFVRDLPERAARDQKGIDAQLLKRFCLERINGGGMEPVSVNSDAKARPPAIYWDSASGQYMSLSYWDWQNRNFEWPTTGTHGSTYNIGGPDGFGIAYDKPVYMRSYRMSYWGNDTSWFPTTTTYTASSANAYGVGFTFQDRVKRTNYNGNKITDSNAAHGQIVNFFLNGQSGCRSIYGFSKYAHTWSSTHVTGVSIGAYSIGFSWNTTSNQWTSASQPGQQASVCY
jgi:hypothetical protein